MASVAPKRGPTVLVTDAREQSRRSQRPSANRMGTGVISVDSILQYASDIPSAQRRGPPSQRPVQHRTASGRHPLDPKLTGRLVPQHIPSRTSKVSEKLVLIPEAHHVDDEHEKFKTDVTSPPRDDELMRGKQLLIPGKTYAESQPKAWRTEKIPRVTAYGTAESYKIRAAAEFLRSKHGARTKLYDDCLYVVYQLPLLPGLEGIRIRSSPILKSPGGKALLDEEIERNEMRERHDGYYENVHHFGPEPSPEILDSQDIPNMESPEPIRSSSPTPGSTNLLSFAEMFVFSYGVVVFWNFTERQEKDCLADMAFSISETGTSLATRPQPETDFETEEFHFEYNPDVARPRVYNDMFTLRSGDHMIKLAISHATAQSTKLSYFEERMERTMIEARHIPKTLALTGSLGMKREEVVKILGRLFTSRVDVNLSSNILDTPMIFWENEPNLHPLYSAVREYLEIRPRIQVLNERCQVFLDLAEILSDAIADKKMTNITWIIIILIIISIFVTCSEVFLRFGLLSGSKHKDSDQVFMISDNIYDTKSLNFTSAARSTARFGLIISWILFGTSML